MDDEPHIRALYKELLRQAGHEVEVAEDGWEGFMSVGMNQYALILSDLNMPNWDGAVSIDSIHELYPHIRFIVITGFIDSDYTKQVQNHPAVHCVLEKPVSPLQVFFFVDPCTHKNRKITSVARILRW